MKPDDIGALVFDLDDTLHPEAAFVGAGFVVVAAELERRGVGSTPDTCRRLESLQRRGNRSRVLQALSEDVGFPAEWIPELVDAFRAHQPQMDLAPEVAASLSAWSRRWRLGCITDGRPETQHRKVRALGLSRWMEVIVFTDGFGPGWRKPDPRPFHLTCTLLECAPARTLFVGDHPVRDVGGAGGAGLRTVRIRRPDGYLGELPDSRPPDALFDDWPAFATWVDGGMEGRG